MKEFECYKCGKRFTQKSHMDTHLKKKNDCEKCNARFVIESFEYMCDDKTEREIMGDVSMQEHNTLLRKFREKIKSMNLTFELEV